MTDVEIIPEGIIELLNEPDSLAALNEAAQAIVDVGRVITRRGEDPRYGHLADRYFTHKAEPGPTGPEAAACNSSPVFHLEEFGSINQTPQRPFYRSISEAGYEPEALEK